MVLLKIVLENIEATRPWPSFSLSALHRWMRPWEDAIKGRHHFVIEERMLTDLQAVLGYTDDQVAIIAAHRSSARRAVRRGRVNSSQLDFLKRGLPTN